MFGSAVAHTSEDNWVSVGVNNWKKGIEKVKSHEQSHVHIEAAIAHMNFVSKGSVTDQISNEAAAQKQIEIRENRELLERILDIIFSLAKQNLAFRGHRENESAINKGNFLELISLLAKYDVVLQHHVKDAKRNQKYYSPEIQNEFIKSMTAVVTKHIVSRIKEASYYSLIMDETTDNSRVSFVKRTGIICVQVRN